MQTTLGGSHINSKKQGTLHHKLLKSTFILSLSAMFVLVISLLSIFTIRFIKNDWEASQREIEYIAEQVKFIVDSAENYSKIIMIDDTVHDILFQYNKDSKFDAVLQRKLQDRILSLVQSIPYFHSVSIYDTNKLLLSSSEPYTTTPFLEINCDFKLSDKNIIFESKTRKDKNKQEIWTLSLIRPLYSYETSDLLGYIEISILEERLREIYINSIDEYTQVFFVDENNIIQSCGNPNMISTPYTEKRHFFNSVIYDLQTIFFQTNIDRPNWRIIKETELYYFLQPILLIILIPVSGFFISLIIYVFILKRKFQSIFSPIRDLINHMQKIKSGNWLPINKQYEFTDIQILFDSFDSMIYAQEALKNELIEAEIKKNKLSLDLLQEQINPHFLYNTLENICALAEIEEKQVLIDTVMNLSSFYRETLNSGKNIISLESELNLTTAYLEIMKVRYFNKFDYIIDCPNHLKQIKCLKLLLQPIVENSIYHGINKIDYFGSIYISIKKLEHDVIIEISDNGPSLDDKSIDFLMSVDSNSFGIRNINERIKYYYGENYGLSLVQNTDKTGLTVILKISERVVN